MKWEGWQTVQELIAGAIIVSVVRLFYVSIKDKWWAK